MSIIETDTLNSFKVLYHLKQNTLHVVHYTFHIKLIMEVQNEFFNNVKTFNRKYKLINEYSVHKSTGSTLFLKTYNTKSYTESMES